MAKKTIRKKPQRKTTTKVKAKRSLVTITSSPFLNYFYSLCKDRKNDKIAQFARKAADDWRKMSKDEKAPYIELAEKGKRNKESRKQLKSKSCEDFKEKTELKKTRSKTLRVLHRNRLSSGDLIGQFNEKEQEFEYAGPEMQFFASKSKWAVLANVKDDKNKNPGRIVPKPHRKPKRTHSESSISKSSSHYSLYPKKFKVVTPDDTFDYLK